MDSFDNIPPPPELSAVPLPAPSSPVEDGTSAAVDLLDVLLLIVFAVLAYLIAGTLAGVAYMAVYPGRSPQELAKALAQNIYFAVSLQFIVYVLLIGFMAFLARVRHNKPLGQAIQWSPPSRRLAGYALAGGVALALCSDVAEAIFHRWIPKSLPINEYFHDRSSAFLLAAFGVFIAPFVEEMFFRGFLYPALSRWTGRSLSIIITAAGFAILHGSQLAYSLIPLLLIFFVGAVLTIVRARANSVATSVLLHMAYNFTLFSQFYVASQGFRNLQG
jgi:membrane protease YdiL (CAAX protease family)